MPYLENIFDPPGTAADTSPARAEAQLRHFMQEAGTKAFTPEMEVYGGNMLPAVRLDNGEKTVLQWGARIQVGWQIPGTDAHQAKSPDDATYTYRVELRDLAGSTSPTHEAAELWLKLPAGTQQHAGSKKDFALGSRVVCAQQMRVRLLDNSVCDIAAGTLLDVGNSPILPYVCIVRIKATRFFAFPPDKFQWLMEHGALFLADGRPPILHDGVQDFTVNDRIKSTRYTFDKEQRGVTADCAKKVVAAGTTVEKLCESPVGVHYFRTLDREKFDRKVFVLAVEEKQT